MTEGLLTIAYGPKKYAEMAQALSMSYRRHDPSRPIFVVTDERNRATLEKYFDSTIPIRMDYGSGVVQKLHADLYSPFERTLFVDSDCLFYKSPDRLWGIYAHGDFSVRGWRYLTGETDYEKREPYDMVDDTTKLLRLTRIQRLAHFNSGVFYFERSDVSSRVFAIARSIYEKRTELGFIKFKNAPIADEPAFAIAMEMCGIEMDPWDSDNGMETAINIESISEINVLSGTARFRKSGVERNPTLVHFNVGAQYGATYGREMLRLRHEKRALRSLYVGVGLSAWLTSSMPARFRDRSINGTRKLQRLAKRLLQQTRARTPRRNVR